jgi:hypothetical protein
MCLHTNVWVAAGQALVAAMSEHTKPEVHPSQTDHKKEFRGKFIVETDKVYKSAKEWKEKGSTKLRSAQVSWIFSYRTICLIIKKQFNTCT